MEVIVDLKKCCEKKYLMKVGVRNTGMKRSETMKHTTLLKSFLQRGAKKWGNTW